MFPMRSLPNRRASRRRAVLPALAAAAALPALLAGAALPEASAPASGRQDPTPAAPAGGPAAAKDAARDRVVAEIREFEDRFNRAYEANDMKTYWGFYSDDMTQYWQEGRLDLPEYRKFWEKELADGARMLEVRTADMVIHVGPSLDTAVAAYRIFTKMRRPDGSVAESWNQETDVLFKRDGRWRVVHMHYSDAPPAKTGS
jgi:ketosteroid isomerase-like protein